MQLWRVFTGSWGTKDALKSNLSEGTFHGISICWLILHCGANILACWFISLSHNAVLVGIIVTHFCYLYYILLINLDLVWFFLFWFLYWTVLGTCSTKSSWFWVGFIWGLWMHSLLDSWVEYLTYKKGSSKILWILTGAIKWYSEFFLNLVHSCLLLSFLRKIGIGN